MSLGLQIIFGGLFFGYLFLFGSVVMVFRGWKPAWFARHHDAQLIAGIPYQRTESASRWGIVLIASLFLAFVASALHHKLIPEQPDLSKTVLELLKQLVQQRKQDPVLAPRPAVPNAPAPKRLAGFVQVTSIVVNTKTLNAKTDLDITAHMRRDGEGQVHNAFMSPNLVVIYFDHAPTDKDDKDADEVAKRNLRMFRLELGKRKVPGEDLGSQSDAFQTAHIKLSQEQVDGFTNGLTRIYLLLVIRWEDSNQVKGHIDSCQWLQATPTLNIGLEKQVWHGCRS